MFPFYSDGIIALGINIIELASFQHPSMGQTSTQESEQEQVEMELWSQHFFKEVFSSCFLACSL